MGCAFRISPVSTSGPQLDVQSGDPQLLAPLSHILSCQHSSIRRGLVSVGLHLHPTGNTADCFSEDQEEGKLIQKMITIQSKKPIYFLHRGIKCLAVELLGINYITHDSANKHPIRESRQAKYCFYRHN